MVSRVVVTFVATTSHVVLAADCQQGFWANTLTECTAQAPKLFPGACRVPASTDTQIKTTLAANKMECKGTAGEMAKLTCVSGFVAGPTLESANLCVPGCEKGKVLCSAAGNTGTGQGSKSCQSKCSGTDLRLGNFCSEDSQCTKRGNTSGGENITGGKMVCSANSDGTKTCKCPKNAASRDDCVATASAKDSTTGEECGQTQVPTGDLTNVTYDVNTLAPGYVCNAITEKVQCDFPKYVASKAQAKKCMKYAGLGQECDSAVNDNSSSFQSYNVKCDAATNKYVCTSDPQGTQYVKCANRGDNLMCGEASGAECMCPPGTYLPTFQSKSCVAAKVGAACEADSNQRPKLETMPASQVNATNYVCTDKKLACATGAHKCTSGPDKDTCVEAAVVCRPNPPAAMVPSSGFPAASGFVLSGILALMTIVAA